MRPAMRAATNAENADSNPAQKKIAPLTARRQLEAVLEPHDQQGCDHEPAAE